MHLHPTEPRFVVFRRDVKRSSLLSRNSQHWQSCGYASRKLLPESGFVYSSRSRDKRQLLSGNEIFHEKGFRPNGKS